MGHSRDKSGRNGTIFGRGAYEIKDREDDSGIHRSDWKTGL